MIWKPINYKKDIVVLGEGIKSSELPLKDLAKVGDKCPICQSDITPEKKSDLQEGYKKTIKDNEEKNKIKIKYLFFFNNRYS